MKKPNQKLVHKRPDGYSGLRIYHREGRGKQSPRLLIKCGDCEEKFEIHYDPNGRDIEIAGVFGSVENWREVLLPLLKRPARKKLSYRPLEEYLAERPSVRSR
jgi:hypothetical protein